MSEPLTAEELDAWRIGISTWPDDGTDRKRVALRLLDLALEAERLRTNFRRITGWDDEQLEQGMIHLEEAAMVKARRLAGTESQG